MTPTRILVAFFLLVLPRPDEGQWLPQQLLEMDWDALRARGLALTKDEFWHPTEGGVLSAAVQIGGCSASFVSGEGLVVTNHHCGFGAIQQLSTVERNLVQNGFVASSRAEELPAPGMVVYVVRRIEDVTAQIHAAQAKAKDDLDRWRMVDAEMRRLVEEGEGKEPDTTCQVASFLNGRHYHLYFRTRIPDVRLVYAPPRSIGEFGGEEDNWMWPRHTGDFAFFRAYVGKNGQPAAPSPENVPYRPKHFLKVAKDGVKEGDLAMVLGYPGRTERYLTSTAVHAREQDLYPLRLDLLTEVLRVLAAAGKDDPARELRLSSLNKSVANVQKNALGMVKGLARNQVEARKRQEEEAFSAWVKADPERTKRYGNVLGEMLEIDAGEARYLKQDEILNSVMRFSPLLATLANACDIADQLARPEDQRERGTDAKTQAAALARLEQPNLTRDLEVIERPLLRYFMAAAARHLDGEHLLALREGAGDPSEASSLADQILGTTTMLDPTARKRLFSGGAEAIEASDDPLVRMARGLAGEVRAMRMRNRNLQGRRLVVGNLWIEAQEKWRGAAFYPDANGTLRVSVATVQGYDPRDGVRYLPQTTLRGVLQKETGAEPFASPKPLLEAAGASDLGRFMDPRLGDVPVCFLTNADTTGGNSGSPVINGRGELIGLNFDRVFENVAGDFGWNAALSRNVCVDVRYIGWVLDRVLPAPHVLQELGL